VNLRPSKHPDAGIVRAALCAVVGAALLGCGRDLPPKPSTSVRDSAGITIVENRGDASQAALGWKLGAAPTVDIGGGGAAAGPYRVVEATRLGDGRIVVASAGSNALDLYAPTGEHLRTVGRPGGGPGEFQALFWVGRLPGDSIAAWDASLGRLSVFSPAGDFVRAVTPRSSLGLFPLAAGVLGDGRVLIAVRSASAGLGSGIRVQRDDVSYVALASDGSVQPVGRFPGTEMLLSSVGGGLLMRPLPFGRQTVAAARGERVYVGTGDAFELRAYEPGRGLRAIIRAQHQPVPVTATEVRDYQRTLVTLGAEGDARLRRQQAEMLEKAPYPKAMPPFTDLKVDPDGNLWTRGPTPPAASDARWTVFSPDGRIRGIVTVPAGLTVREIGRDWVLGTVLDDDEVEHVRVYTLIKKS
jgi:hypothetical protein